MLTTRSQTAPRREIVAHSNVSPQLQQGGPNLRQRTQDAMGTSARRNSSNHSHEPPRFVVDLSLPPGQRYLEVCAALKSEISGLTALFDEVVGEMVSFLPISWVHHICRLLLRGIYNEEENAELLGISKATGVSMYLLVCFNVLLDLFMGCSSGGAAIQEEESGRTRMLHFRTLDWAMPALRRVVVHLDFVTETGGPIMASSITYAGFVGVLTGVRKDLSISLNFRQSRNGKGTFRSDALYAWHLLLVLLGKRASIASTLRFFLLPKASDALPKYCDLKEHFASGEMAGSGRKTFVSTACYLCFSDGTETTVVEKDRVTAKTRSSKDFIVITNNDKDTDHYQAPRENDTRIRFEPPATDGIEEIMRESQEREQCAEHNWQNMKAQHAQQSDRRGVCTGMQDVVTLVQKYPTTNEVTHFACVMDPNEGVVRWCRRWLQPVGAKWIREHESDPW